MLSELLSLDLVRCGAVAADWREAIRQAGGVLESAGACDASYTEAMVDAAERFGPYMVLEKGIAMPHARAEGNVSKAGVCVVTLKEPVCFGKEEFDPVWVLLGICAPDPGAHLQCLRDLTAFFEDEGAVFRLRGCATREEVLSVVERVG